MARKLVAADLSSAEARIFAHYSGDKRLQEVYIKGEDLYSRVAIDVFDRDDLSAHPDDPNFVKKVDPDLRNRVKVFVLAVVYGSGGYQIAASLGLLNSKGEPDSKEGQKIINKYLSTYPNLKKYMIRQELMLKQQGFVTNMFGRIRRFDTAFALYKKYGDNLENSMWAKRNGLSEERKVFKKALNAAKNFPIQSTCASLVNRAMIEFQMWAESADVDVKLILTVHDEIVVTCAENSVEEVSKQLQYCMENNKFTTSLEVPLVADPIVGDNLAECK